MAYHDRSRFLIIVWCGCTSPRAFSHSFSQGPRVLPSVTIPFSRSSEPHSLSSQERETWWQKYTASYPLGWVLPALAHFGPFHFSVLQAVLLKNTPLGYFPHDFIFFFPLFSLSTHMPWLKYFSNTRFLLYFHDLDLSKFIDILIKV